MTDTNSESDVKHLSFEELSALLERIFLSVGASPSVAAMLAANCAACEQDGSISHGIFRMPGYVSTILSGWVDPAAIPQVETSGASLIRVDAMNGYAQPALEAAMPALLTAVEQNGAAVLAISNSHHFSALWPDVEPFAERGLIALSVVNSFACAVPFGAKAPVFGTNPLAYAFPGENHPIVVDMATSSIANGDVQIAAREGRQLPAGYGVDKHGNPTTDPNEVLNGGSLLTFGGHKGAAISMMVELLSAALTGGKFSYEVDWTGYPGAQSPRTGQLFIIIDPDRGRQPNAFAARAQQLLDQLDDAGATRLPGERRRVNRKRAEEEGIPISRENLAMLESLLNAQQ